MINNSVNNNGKLKHMLTSTPASSHSNPQTGSAAPQSLSFDDKLKKAKVMVPFLKSVLPGDIENSDAAFYKYNMRIGTFFLMLAAFSKVTTTDEYVNPLFYFCLLTEICSIYYFSKGISLDKRRTRTTQETKDFVASHPQIFAQESNKTLVYDSQNNKRPLTIHSGAKAEITLTRDVFPNYSPSVLEYMIDDQGRFMGIETIENGATSVTGRIGKQCGLLHYVDPEQSPHMDSLYCKIDLRKAAEQKEIERIELIFNTVVAHFEPYNSPAQVKYRHQIHKNKRRTMLTVELCNLDDTFAKKSGLCHEQTLSLAYLLDKAKKEGYLHGEYQLERRTSVKLVESHIWLTYLLPQGAGQLVIDPVNHCLQLLSTLREGEDDFILQYYREPVTISLKGYVDPTPSERILAENLEKESQSRRLERYCSYAKKVGIGLLGAGISMFVRKCLPGGTEEELQYQAAPALK